MVSDHAGEVDLQSDAEVRKKRMRAEVGKDDSVNGVSMGFLLFKEL